MNRIKVNLQQQGKHFYLRYFYRGREIKEITKTEQFLKKKKKNTACKEAVSI